MTTVQNISEDRECFNPSITLENSLVGETKYNQCFWLWQLNFDGDNQTLGYHNEKFGCLNLFFVVMQINRLFKISLFSYLIPRPLY